MATVQQGTKALVFHTPSADITLGGNSLVGAIIISDFSFTPTAKEIRTEDDAGNTINITTYDFGAEATLTVKPQGSSAANAVTAAGYFPTIGAVCTVVTAGSPATFTNSQFSATSSGRSYRVKSATKNNATGQAETWTLTIERLDSISSMTALS